MLSSGRSCGGLSPCLLPRLSSVDGLKWSMFMCAPPLLFFDSVFALDYILFLCVAVFRLCVFFLCENLASFGCFVRRAVRKGIWREKSVPLCPFSALRFFSFAKIWRLSGVSSAGRCEKALGAKNLYPCALFRLCVFLFCENLASFGCFFRRAVRKGTWREKSLPLCPFSPLRFSLLRKFGVFRVFLPPGGAKRHLARKISTPVPFLAFAFFSFAKIWRGREKSVPPCPFSPLRFFSFAILFCENLPCFGPVYSSAPLLRTLLLSVAT